jgi:hypothetical protein
MHTPVVLRYTVLGQGSLNFLTLYFVFLHVLSRYNTCMVSWNTLSTARNLSLYSLALYLLPWSMCILSRLSTARNPSLYFLILYFDVPPCFSDPVPGVMKNTVHGQEPLPALPLHPGLLERRLLLHQIGKIAGIVNFSGSQL